MRMFCIDLEGRAPSWPSAQVLAEATAARPPNTVWRLKAALPGRFQTRLRHLYRVRSTRLVASPRAKRVAISSPMESSLASRTTRPSLTRRVRL